jgi:hypothetical protein
MCKICRAKAKRIGLLAQYFREKSGETCLQQYITMMSDAAQTLDELAVKLNQSCQLNDIRGERRGQPQREPESLINWNPDPAWLRYASCAQ